MCRGFSCLVLPSKKVLWRFGVDSHSDLVSHFKLKDDTAEPNEMTFARGEITPDNGNYLAPDRWSLKVDEAIRPTWFSATHEEACFAAHRKWVKQLATILIPKPIVYPFKIDPPVEITKHHISLLRQWVSVGDSVGASVRASVRDSMRDSVGASVWASVGASVRASVRRDSVEDSVGDSVWAYIGSFFRLPKWKYVNHARGKYPFAAGVSLWKQGLVPSFDGTTWRLHGGQRAKILFEILPERLTK